MRLYTFRNHNQQPVAVNLDALLYAEPFRMNTHAPEQTQLVFAPGTFVVIDMPVAGFVDLMTR